MHRYMEFAHSSGERTGPEDTCVVMDLSITMKLSDYKPSRLAAAKEATENLLDVNCESYPSDRVGIVGFSRHACVIYPLAKVGENVDRMKKALRRAKASSTTNIRVGLECAGQLLTDHSLMMPPHHTRGIVARSSRLSRNVDPTPTYAEPIGRTQRVILLTDGKHNTGLRPEPIAEGLKRRGICIDVIGIGGSPNAPEFDESCLKRIASKNPDGSPRYYFIGDKTKLVKKFRTLAHHIRRVEG